jgi:hypothetical protein
MIFSLSYLLYAFYAFLLVWGLLMAVSIYHVFKYGFLSIGTFLSTVFFIGGAIILLAGSFWQIGQLDWSEEMSLVEPFTLSDNKFN